MTNATSLPNPANAAAAQMQYDNEKKTPGIAYALWFFLGVVGGHRFYSGDTGYALGLLFTLGGLGVWALIDVFFIGNRIKQKNAELQNHIMRTHGITV